MTDHLHPQEYPRTLAGLRQMVQQRHQESRTAARNSSVLQDWDYHIFKKERELPEAMRDASRAIEDIRNMFEKIAEGAQLISKLRADLKPEGLQEIELALSNSLALEENILESLEIDVNTLKVFWVPETVEQLFLGAYQSVRHPPIPCITPQLLPDTCSICQEEFGKDMGAPVSLVRRCHLNPLLRLMCNDKRCECNTPSICLKCVLEHVLQNCILEGKSSVRCPLCRGEFCIYDIQEIQKV